MNTKMTMGKKEPNKRIKKLMTRRDKVVSEKRRNLYYDSVIHGIYQWSPGSTAFTPVTGKLAIAEKNRVSLGDQDCRVGVDYPFPGKELPSSKNGFSWDPENWAKDYAYFLDNSPAEIYENEFIVGEFHWRFDELREFRYPEELDELGFKAREAGSGGNSLTHTCPDLSIGLNLGWKGILEKIKKHKKKFEEDGEEKRVEYLRAAEKVCMAIMRYIEKHTQKAQLLTQRETNESKKENYLTIAKVCENISKNPPSNLREAIQWIQFYQIAERTIGHGNGYGRFDQYLKKLYFKDIEEGSLTKEQARNLIAELFMKYGGNYFSLAGRDEEGKDATNKLSWVCLEAYDMVGGHNCLSVMWHEDIDKEFFAYACDVVKRHGCATPVLPNYDVMKESELYSGYKEEDAWNVSLGGCQWYCVPGKEYSDQDKNCIVIIQCFMQALKTAFKKNIQNFDELWKLYCEEIDKAIRALRDLKDAQYKWQPLIWPEIVTSLQMHGCIEKGKDVTDIGAVSYNFTSVNLLGFTNVADSLCAIKKLVFKDRKISLQELEKAMEASYEGYEEIRQLLLNAPKFGNDEDEVDKIAVMVAEQAIELLEKYKTCKGFNFRPSLFHFMGHIAGGPLIGVTPDGRKKEEPLAQGCNPMHGRNSNSITATMNSLSKLPFEKVQGGICQLEIEPSFFSGDGSNSNIVEALVAAYFEKGGVQVVMNVVSEEDLKAAIKHPEKYSHIVVKVTGYSAHFVQLDKKFQEEIIKRTRHQRV